MLRTTQPQAWLALLVTLLANTWCQAQISHAQFLTQNRQDLNQNSQLSIAGAKVIAFGALHGSSKTEDAEVALLKELATNHGLQYYLPETDYGTGRYFQKFIETGDEKLLEQLMLAYKRRVPQEGSVDVFNKWKKLRPLFLEHGIKVLGIDKIASYKFTVKALMDLIPESVYLDSFQVLLDNQDTRWSGYYTTETRKVLQRFVTDYESRRPYYLEQAPDTFAFKHVIFNLKQTFEKTGRGDTYYANYQRLAQHHQLQNTLQFFRFGVFHIMKSRINNVPTLLSRLIENQDYAANEILSIQAFLTKSKVLWNRKLDRGLKYKGYSTRAGYGISDYWLEYYKGIKHLKKQHLSDFTLFTLNGKDSPYKEADDFQLVQTNMLFGKDSWVPSPGKSTLDYIDCAILIRNSKANTPIEELQLP